MVVTFFDYENSEKCRYTCICLPFPGASLVGREEYILEDSPSFLGSIGLFGRSGKPERERNKSIIVKSRIISLFLKHKKHLFCKVYSRAGRCIVF